MNKTIVSASPHVVTDKTTRRIMYDVIIALLPALAVAIYIFGLPVVYLTLVAVVSCVGFEYLIQKYLFKIPTTIRDGSAAVTGLLLAFNLPSNLPLWMVILGSLFAIGLAKQSFGGLGNNIFNPALAGRVFLLISFPTEMTSWPIPFVYKNLNADAVTSATPLGVIKEGLSNGQQLPELLQSIPSHTNLLLGVTGGSLGEISALALLIGAAYLLIRKVITWHIPVSMLLTMAVISLVAWQVNPMQFASPVFHLLAGGAILGAFYMATDMVTSPMSYKGMLLFGFGIGLITMAIRYFGAYPESLLLFC